MASRLSIKHHPPFPRPFLTLYRLQQQQRQRGNLYHLPESVWQSPDILRPVATDSLLTRARIHRDRSVSEFARTPR